MSATITATPAATRMSDDTLGSLLWDAWVAIRTAHPTRLAAARTRLSDLATEARTRGYLVTIDHMTVGQSVIDAHGITGTVTAIDGDSVTVTWPTARVPNLPATQQTNFLASALLTGALSAA